MRSRGKGGGGRTRRVGGRLESTWTDRRRDLVAARLRNARFVRREAADSQPSQPRAPSIDRGGGFRGWWRELGELLIRAVELAGVVAGNS